MRRVLTEVSLREIDNLEFLEGMGWKEADLREVFIRLREGWSISSVPCWNPIHRRHSGVMQLIKEGVTWCPICNQV